METIERWLPVQGFPGYEVSDSGRVRSVDRVDSIGRLIRGRLLSDRTRDRGGHHLVTVSVDGVRSTLQIHSLVLAAFVGPRPPGMEGCHDDGDPDNNALTNLRWDTHSSNMRDKVKHGTHNMARRSHCPRGHELKAPNLIPANLRQGSRACLSCGRARSRARRSTEPVGVIAEEIYRELRAVVE